jgi:hypothetical protein
LCQINIFLLNYYFTVWSVVAGGRKCNFEGCDKPQFKPTIENGWYWASTGNTVNEEKNQNDVANKSFITRCIWTGVRIPSTKRCPYCEWSNTGGLKEPQPDNRYLLASVADPDPDP